MKPPEISTFICCKDHGKYLGDAIESVMSQTFKPTEIILLDDGSKDHTQQVMKRYADKDKRFRRITHETPLKNIRSYNHCLDLCKGDFIHLMAADDKLSDQTFYEDATLILMTQPIVGYVSIGLQWMDEEARLLPTQVLPPVEGKIHANAALQLMKTHGNFTNGGGTLVRKKAQWAAGRYDEKFPYSADFVNWIRILGKGFAAYYFKRPGYLYRKHSKQMTHQNVTPEHELRGCYEELEKAISNVAIRDAKEALEQKGANV